MDTILTSVVSAKAKSSNPLDEFLGGGEGEDSKKKPKVDMAVIKAEAEAAAQADRDARAPKQERRKTDHEARVAQMRQKYNLQEPPQQKEKKGLFGSAKSATEKERTEEGNSAGEGDDSRRKSAAPATVGTQKEKWYKKLFK